MMALDDYFESEVGIAVAATAIVLSPQLRGWLRRGAVYGLAAALKAGDAVSSAARGVATEVQSTAAASVDAAKQTTDDAKVMARGSRTTRSTQAE
jgi:hypothetical protein